jgi:predicted transposase YdaD
LKIAASSVEHPFRRHTLEQLSNLRISLQARQNLNKDERGLIMSLSPVYERWKEETLQKGIQEGKQQGKQEQRRELLEVFLVNRFGAVDAEMASLIPTMAQLPDAELAGLMLQLANLSREELLERFGR